MTKIGSSEKRSRGESHGSFFIKGEIGYKEWICGVALNPVNRYNIEKNKLLIKGRKT